MTTSELLTFIAALSICAALLALRSHYVKKLRRSVASQAAKRTFHFPLYLPARLKPRSDRRVLYGVVFLIVFIFAFGALALIGPSFGLERDGRIFGLAALVALVGTWAGSHVFPELHAVDSRLQASTFGKEIVITESELSLSRALFTAGEIPDREGDNQDYFRIPLSSSEVSIKQWKGKDWIELYYEIHDRGRTLNLDRSFLSGQESVFNAALNQLAVKGLRS